MHPLYGPHDLSVPFPEYSALYSLSWPLPNHLRCPHINSVVSATQPGPMPDTLSDESTKTPSPGGVAHFHEKGHIRRIHEIYYCNIS